MSKIYKVEILSIELVEVLEKSNRPYLGIDISMNKLSFIVPLRSNIDSRRINRCFDCFPIEKEENKNHGIDFTKAIIKDKNIKCERTNIDNNVYREIKKNEKKIKISFEKYLKVLSRDLNRLKDNDLDRKYMYCSLYMNVMYKKIIKDLL